MVEIQIQASLKQMLINPLLATSTAINATITTTNINNIVDIILNLSIRWSNNDGDHNNCYYYVISYYKTTAIAEYYNIMFDYICMWFITHSKPTGSWKTFNTIQKKGDTDLTCVVYH